MPDDTTGGENDRVGRAFRLALDREGHSFHQRVLHEGWLIAGRMNGTEHRLSFEVSEFPVQTRGKDSRVDFILRIKSVWSSPPILLVCECKRSNPAFADWCFARTPYVNRRALPRVIVDRLTVDKNTRTMLSTAVSIASTVAPYQVGLPVKGDEKGDPIDKGNPREAIERAAGQVMQGLNGFADFLHANKQVLGADETLLVPVIFTTAVLYTSEVNLADATLETGALPVDRVDVQRCAWLWFQYPVSSSLRHSIDRQRRPDTFASVGGVLDVEHSRSIAIVSVDGIEPFLRSVGNVAELCDEVR
jgi:hypothetical protein